MAKKKLLFHALTNHKLHHVRLLLDLAKQDQQDDFVRSALLESAVYQLVLSYRSFLGEMACFVNLDQFVLDALNSITAKELKLLLVEHNKVIAEFEEVLLLEDDKHSWLSELLFQHQQAFLNKLDPSPVHNEVDSTLVSSPKMIAIKGVSWPVVPSLSVEDIQAWRSALYSLVLKVREYLQEW